MCSYKGDRITVTYRNDYKGDYILLREPYCLRCAYPGVTTATCSWHWDDYGFERIYAMGAYLSPDTPEGRNDFLSNHIRGLKKYPRYATPLGLGLVECIRGRYPELLKMDLIVPIPLFDTELKVSRDPVGIVYNQSVELSKEISKGVNILYTEVLEKTREQKMKDLTARAQRKEAVKGLYRIRSGERKISGKKILLIDDVSTSGATASECSQVLINAGAEIVNVLVAGRDIIVGV